MSLGPQAGYTSGPQNSYILCQRRQSRETGTGGGQLSLSSLIPRWGGGGRSPRDTTDAKLCPVTHPRPEPKTCQRTGLRGSNSNVDLRGHSSSPRGLLEISSKVSV